MSKVNGKDSIGMIILDNKDILAHCAELRNPSTNGQENNHTLPLGVNTESEHMERTTNETAASLPATPTWLMTESPTAAKPNTPWLQTLVTPVVTAMSPGVMYNGGILVQLTPSQESDFDRFISNVLMVDHDGLQTFFEEQRRFNEQAPYPKSREQMLEEPEACLNFINQQYSNYLNGAGTRIIQLYCRQSKYKKKEFIDELRDRMHTAYCLSPYGDCEMKCSDATMEHRNDQLFAVHIYDICTNPKDDRYPPMSFALFFFFKLSLMVLDMLKKGEKVHIPNTPLLQKPTDSQCSKWNTEQRTTITEGLCDDIYNLDISESLQEKCCTIVRYVLLPHEGQSVSVTEFQEETWNRISDTHSSHRLDYKIGSYAINSRVFFNLMGFIINQLSTEWPNEYTQGLIVRDYLGEKSIYYQREKDEHKYSDAIKDGKRAKSTLKRNSHLLRSLIQVALESLKTTA